MTESTEISFWKKCSSCKTPIDFGAKYQTCSVSSCNSKKLGLVFCSVSCWDAHLGFARHRDSSAIEERAPGREQFLQTQQNQNPIMTDTTPKKIIIRPENPASSSNETLVVVSKVKKLIQDFSGYNTSQCAINALTEVVMKECHKAIENARSAGRKTVMGRDF